ncbi:MAG: DUF2868 domain-containing protein [Pseudobacteriovorax sp.]|nr:DUF2868 domain-containing protein [Pseudobacteriovorax sp.]
MKLSDLINIEYRIFKDRDLVESELETRDYSLEFATNLSDSQLLTDWARKISPNNIGLSVMHRVSVGRLITGLAVFLLGVGLAFGLTHRDPGITVNLFWMLAIFIGPQSLFLIIQVLFGFKSPAFQALLRSRWPQFSSLHYYSVLYGSIEKWFLFQSLQLMAILLNIGLLLGLMATFTLTDVYFSWGTTLSVGPETIYLVCQWISIPWSFYQEAVPSIELIEITQYSSLNQSYAGTSDRAGQWWQFVMLCTAVYGLLPRIVLYLVSSLRLQQSLNRVDFSHTDARRILSRLRRPSQWGRHIDQDTKPEVFSDEKATPVTNASASAIVWRDLPVDDQALKTMFDKASISIRHIYRIDGGEGHIASVLANEEQEPVQLYICVDYWESFGKALKRFTDGLKVPVYIVPLILDPDPRMKNEDLWKQALKNEPFLGVWSGP